MRYSPNAIRIVFPATTAGVDDMAAIKKNIFVIDFFISKEVDTLWETLFAMDSFLEIGRDPVSCFICRRQRHEEGEKDPIGAPPQPKQTRSMPYARVPERISQKQPMKFLE